MEPLRPPRRGDRPADRGGGDRLRREHAAWPQRERTGTTYDDPIPFRITPHARTKSRLRLPLRRAVALPARPLIAAAIDPRSRAQPRQPPRPTSAPPGSAANACAKSSTTISPCRRTRAATSSRDPAIFEAGHRGEDVVAGWLRLAGFDLRTQRSDGRQFGFSALDGRFRGHIDGCLVAGPAPLAYPRCGRTRRSAPRPGRTSSSGASSWQNRLRGADRPLPSLPRAAEPGALHRAQPRHHGALRERCRSSGLAQRMSDRAVEVVRASDAEELCRGPRSDRTSTVCRGGSTAGDVMACPWQDRCWPAADRLTPSDTQAGPSPPSKTGSRTGR